MQMRRAETAGWRLYDRNRTLRASSRYYLASIRSESRLRCQALVAL